MQLKEAAAHLQQCGITRHQALVFLNLARLGSSTAREVAQAAGVNRVQTYRALDSLLGRGLVEVSLDRPKRYLARPVQEALEIFVEEHRGHLAAAEHVRQALLSSWPNLVTKNSPVVRVQLLKGSSQIYGALRRSVSAARKEVLAFTTTKGVTRSYRQGINEALLQALGRGVAARLIVDIRADNAVLFRKVADRVPVRHVEGQRGRFIIIDREAVIAFLIQDEGGLRGEAETALWTNSPDFVRMNVEFFDLAWRSGTPAEDRFRSFLGN